ncbi:hypothetical protein Fmac_023557 [Flemingia macrophylla]|uniref:Uncharacterized protein n=1 Tax=Flemingia macrophylla TaxID=520843 RepID=A0ABD1LLV4_9FABA
MKRLGGGVSPGTIETTLPLSLTAFNALSLCPEKLQDEMQNCSEDEAFLKVCGKEHSGYVRGMGLGVSPSQIIGSSSRATSSTTSFESNERIEQMQAEIDSLKAQVAEVDILKSQIAFLMKRATRDQTPDLESLVNRRSSEGSHMPEGGNNAITEPSRCENCDSQGNRRSNRRYVKIATGCATVGLTVAKSARDGQLCDDFPTVAILALRQLQPSQNALHNRRKVMTWSLIVLIDEETRSCSDRCDIELGVMMWAFIVLIDEETRSYSDRFDIELRGHIEMNIYGSLRVKSDINSGNGTLIGSSSHALNTSLKTNEAVRTSTKHGKINNVRGTGNGMLLLYECSDPCVIGKNEAKITESIKFAGVSSDGNESRAFLLYCGYREQEGSVIDNTKRVKEGRFG